MKYWIKEDYLECDMVPLMGNWRSQMFDFKQLLSSVACYIIFIIVVFIIFLIIIVSIIISVLFFLIEFFKIPFLCEFFLILFF